MNDLCIYIYKILDICKILYIIYRIFTKNYVNLFSRSITTNEVYFWKHKKGKIALLFDYLSHPLWRCCKTVRAFLTSCNDCSLLSLQTVYLWKWGYCINCCGILVFYPDRPKCWGVMRLVTVPFTNGLWIWTHIAQGYYSRLYDYQCSVGNKFITWTRVE